MEIVKCSKCNKYIPDASKCFYCGNTMGFETVETPAVHENVVDEYFQVKSLVKSKKFSEALNLSHIVVEWMPNLAGIFWLRLMAKNKCVSVVELIQKGFNCAEDADFCNALAFSKGTEHSVYLDVQNIIFATRKALKAEVIKHEYNCKMKSCILQIKKSMKDEMDTRKKMLISLWFELEEIEQTLYILEKECCLLSKEHRDALANAAQSASLLKTETYRLEECSAESFHRYQLRIGNILEQSGQAKDAMESMKKQNACVKSFNDLVKKRDEQVSLITNEISSLKKYEATIQQTLDEIDNIEERHRNVIRAIESYNFMAACNLLGKDCYNNVFNSLGIHMDEHLSISSQDCKRDTTFTVLIEDDTNDMDMNAYNSALKLSNDSY